MTAVDVATKLIKHHESCYLHAYPDPLSPMGKKLGYAGTVRIGNSGVVPDSVSALNGDPWTIGWGQTGAEIKRGTKWTQTQADDVLKTTVAEKRKAVHSAWPGAHELHPSAEAALISLAYNRGTMIDDSDRRSEMKGLRVAVIKKDYRRMAELFRSMKRLWTLRGLQKRRDDEADLCLQAAAATEG